MRYIADNVRRDLAKKMVFVGGPRQSGKTTLAKSLGAHFSRSRYFNWDFDEDRRAIQSKAWSDDAELLIFDELHKFPRWKNWVKGLYDVRKETHKILVTGSARLDVYRRGGDSLLGRYHYWRLHPFSLSELPPRMTAKVALDRLLTVGGFPEPFLDGDPGEAKRWRRERVSRIVRDDIRDLEPIRDIANLELFVDALRERVSSEVVLSNIAGALHVAPKTLLHWLQILEQMYLVFVVRPYTRKLPRAIQKAPKVFFFDNGDVLGDQGAIFENLVATHLLKELHYREDATGDRWALHYVRDKEGHEVDFVVTCENRVVELVEAKWADTNPSPSLAYFASKLKPEGGCRQIVGTLSKGKGELRHGIRVQSVQDAFPPLGALT